MPARVVEPLRRATCNPVVVIEPAVEALMTCDRLDRRPGSDPMRANFVDGVHRAYALIADVTDLTTNVICEIGQALATRLEPLFYCRGSGVVEPPLGYFRDLNIAPTQSNDDLAPRICTRLIPVRSSARLDAVAE
jgi:hypothetical protein